MTKNITSTTIRIKPKTKDKLDNLLIEISWVEIRTLDDKINHLVWLYENQKFDN